MRVLAIRKIANEVTTFLPTQGLCAAGSGSRAHLRRSLLFSATDFLRDVQNPFPFHIQIIADKLKLR